MAEERYCYSAVHDGYKILLSRYLPGCRHRLCSVNLRDGYNTLSGYPEAGIGSRALLCMMATTYIYIIPLPGSRHRLWSVTAYDGYKMRFTWTITAHDMMATRCYPVTWKSASVVERYCTYMMATRYYPVTWKSASALEGYCA